MTTPTKTLLKQLLARAYERFPNAPSPQALRDYMRMIEDKQFEHGDFNEKLTDLRDEHFRNLPDAKRQAVEEAIWKYTGDYYHDINSLYRTRKASSSTRDVEKHDEALSQGHFPAPEDLVLYRGLNRYSNTARRLTNADNEGQLHRQLGTEGYVSTSTRPDFALDWAGGDPAFAYRMLLPKGTDILPLLNMSSHGAEDEVLLKGGPKIFRTLSDRLPKIEDKYPPSPDDFPLYTHIQENPVKYKKSLWPLLTAYDKWFAERPNGARTPLTDVVLAGERRPIGEKYIAGMAPLGGMAAAPDGQEPPQVPDAGSTDDWTELQYLAAQPGPMQAMAEEKLRTLVDRYSGEASEPSLGFEYANPTPEEAQQIKMQKLAALAQRDIDYENLGDWQPSYKWLIDKMPVSKRRKMDIYDQLNDISYAPVLMPTTPMDLYDAAHNVKAGIEQADPLRAGLSGTFGALQSLDMWPLLKTMKGLIP